MEGILKMSEGLVNIAVEKLLDKPINIILNNDSKVLRKIFNRIKKIIEKTERLVINRDTPNLEVFKTLIFRDKKFFDLIIFFIKKNKELHPELSEYKDIFKAHSRNLKKTLKISDGKIFLEMWFKKIAIQSEKQNNKGDDHNNFLEILFLTKPINLKTLLIQGVDNFDNIYEKFNSFLVY